MKKTLALILALLMILSITLVSCGDKEKETKGSTEDGKLPDAIKTDEGVTAAIDLCCCHGNKSSVDLECFSFFKEKNCSRNGKEIHSEEMC